MVSLWHHLRLGQAVCRGDKKKPKDNHGVHDSCKRITVFQKVGFISVLFVFYFAATFEIFF